MTNASPDVVVIGAGPAGSGGALRLAERGVSVLLVDRQPLPRAKVCGGCLHRRGVKRLSRWGVANEVLHAAGAERLVTSEVVTGGRALRWPRGHGWSVDRAAFDFALAEAAVARGATLEDRTAARVQREESGRWSVRLRRSDGTERVVRPRFVWVADGLGGSALSGLSGADDASLAVRRAVGSYVGAGSVLAFADEAQAEACLPPNCVRMFVGRGGYVGAVRTNTIDGRSTNQPGIEMAAAFEPGLLKACGGAGAAVAQLIGDACNGGISTALDLSTASTATWRMTPALTARRTRVALPGLFIVGDAGGYIEPFTGEGMAWALQAADGASALIAAALSSQCSPEAAAQAWDRRCAWHRRAGRAWCWGTRSVLRRPTLVAALTSVGSRLSGSPLAGSTRQSMADETELEAASRPRRLDVGVLR